MDRINYVIIMFLKATLELKSYNSWVAYWATGQEDQDPVSFPPDTKNMAKNICSFADFSLCSHEKLVN